MYNYTIDQKVLWAKIKSHGYLSGSRKICQDQMPFDNEVTDYDYLFSIDKLFGTFTSDERNWMYSHQNSERRSKEHSWKFYLVVDGEDIPVDLFVESDEITKAWKSTTEVCLHINTVVNRGSLNDKASRVNTFETVLRAFL